MRWLLDFDRAAAWITAATVTIAVACTGCAVDGTDDEIADERAPSAVSAPEFGTQPADDFELDAASGDEVSAQGEDLPGGDAVTYESDDRGGPDPTPWMLTSDSPDADEGGGVVAGPDPTPWHGDAEDDDDDDYSGAAEMGPDPTPWAPEGARDDDEPWMHTVEEDDGEPDPQPWQASRSEDGGSSND